MVKRLVICAGLAVMVLGGVARAQSTASQVVTGYYSTTGCPSGQTSCFVQNGPGSGGSSTPTTPTYVAPTSVTPIPCQAGTGSPITSIGTTATLVCAAGTARSYYNISSAAAAGAPYGYCTNDGTTPSTTHWNFAVYPQSNSPPDPGVNVSPGPLTCISATAMAITAQAIQSGAAP
jgi:hypothetical protein